MTDYYVNEIEIQNKKLLCFSDGRIYRFPHRGRDNRKQQGGFIKQTPCANKYLKLKIDGKYHLSHRVIAEAFLGNYSPDLEVDHIDGDQTNNHVENLRMVTRLQNALGYREKQKGMTSIYRGVHWDKKRKKWESSIVLNKKRCFQKYFNCEHEAAQAWNEAAIKLGYSPEALNVIRNQ